MACVSPDDLMQKDIEYILLLVYEWEQHRHQITMLDLDNLDQIVAERKWQKSLYDAAKVVMRTRFREVQKLANSVGVYYGKQDMLYDPGLFASLVIEKLGG